MPLPEKPVRPEDEVLECSNCSCKWFTQESVQTFKKLHTVVVGQTIPRANDLTFYALKCVKCGHLEHPTVSGAIPDSIYQPYSKFLDELEKK